MCPALDRPIALIGLMGAGKSSVGRVLGERLGVAMADLDSMLEVEEGCSIAELFERAGEAYFRSREGELLERALAAGVRVIACGGGVVLDPIRRARLRERCRVVWLEVTPDEASRRVAGDPVVRPLLAGGSRMERLAAVLAERREFYEQIAEVRVKTDGRPPELVADAVITALGMPE